jgi:hypothetical protein
LRRQQRVEQRAAPVACVPLYPICHAMSLHSATLAIMRAWHQANPASHPRS